MRALNATSAVHLQRYAGDEFGLVGCKPQGRVGDVVGPAHSAERDARHELTPPLGRVLLP